MTSSVIVISLVLLVITGVSIALPLVGRRDRRRTVVEEENTVAGLEAQLSQIINSIYDLDFDFDMGKVPQSDYQTHRKYLVGRGVSTLMQLDEALADQNKLDEEIEYLVANYRGTPVN